MKKLALVTLIFGVSISVIHSQDLSMFGNYTEWQYAQYNGDVCVSVEPNAIIDDDQNGILEIGGIKYHQLYQIMRLDADYGWTIFELGEPLGIREENGKVYVLYDDFMKQTERISKNDLNTVPIPYQKVSENELLLYDFTLQPGDLYPTSAAYEKIFVNEVEMIVTDDRMCRKLFTLTNGLQILEGVGCINPRCAGFTFSYLLFYLYPHEAWKHYNNLFQYRLYEYRKDGKSVYLHPDSVNRLTSVKKVSASQIANNKSLNSKCYDLSGRQIPQSSILNHQLKRGIYIRDGKKVVR